MKEVSVAALDVVLRAVKAKGISLESALEGTGVALALAQKKGERVSWDQYVRIMANARRIFSSEELVSLGGAVLRSPFIRPFSVLGKLLFTAPEFYRFALQKTSGAGNQQFSCVEPSYTEAGDHQIQIMLKLAPGYADCPEFFLISKGTFVDLPRVVGLPPSQVEMTLVPYGAQYLVRMPQGGGVLGRVKRAIAYPFAARAVALELKDANEALTARFHELERAKEEISRRAEQLEIVSALGRELTAYTELAPLARALAHQLTARLSSEGMILSVGSVGEALSTVYAEGRTDGPGKRDLTLAAGGVSIGRLELWRAQAPESDQSDFLDDLVPWISIAVNNARSFDLLKDYQSGLEKRVAERTVQLEQSLQKVVEADRQKTQFFANASHELRTPLTLIIGPLESLTTAEGIPEAAREELRGAVRNSYRLLKLVNDVLDLSKIEAGRLELQFGAMDLSRMLAELIGSWRSKLESRHIKLTLDLPDSLPLIGDRERLEQVALNLISNAVKHTPDGGALRIGASLGEHAEFYVRNTGEGIDPEEAPRLFERFAQSLHSKARRFGSTGLGLSVVRELVEFHGGTISIDNKPGEEVTFRVRLPVRPTGEVSATSQQVSGITGTERRQYEVAGEGQDRAAPIVPIRKVTEGPCILIAEDNIELRNMVAAQLSAEFQVMEAGDGQEALRLARERLPDLILSDMMMPLIDGGQLCKLIREDPATRGIPFILITARGELQDKVLSLEGGADDYIIKPFHFSEVRARVRSQLRVRGLAAQVAEFDRLASLGTLVAGIAHEVRNPLNGILNSLLPLKEMIADPSSDILELLDLAIESCRRVDEISMSLLQQARSGEGNFGPIDLATNVGFAVRLLSHKISDGPELKVDIPPDLGLKVAGEAGALNQIWVNLIDNAIQATGRKGHIKVHAGVDRGNVFVEVKDDGPGIPVTALKRIFDPFFTTKPVGQGTGLGLSVVKTIVERHGGEISVTSTPGEGACFRVVLPAEGTAPLGAVEKKATLSLTR